mmetsp:Transcript_8002/g.12188  ORF Transcript_8002/g.12188 Transcript_8002/m.12188 type:complete len:492 (-) Transcript_8002:1216-2691(-)
MSFVERLERRCEKIGSYLCVGLDPHGAVSGAEAQKICTEIIDATHEYCACYKPNSAFFEAHGAEGWSALKSIIAKIKLLEIPVLLDCKRGDIGSTATQYANACFDELGADAVTLSPYLGWDGLKPFLNADKGAFILCATSNPSANEIQSIEIRRKIAQLCSKKGDWGCQSNALGLVVGATDIQALNLVRSVNKDSWILAPGVGAQGADLRQAVNAAAFSKNKPKLLIPVSRGISNAQDPTTTAKLLRDEINQALEEKEESSTLTTEKLDPTALAFVQAALEATALRFGSFTLKSGRVSPYFFNAGLLATGRQLDILFQAYAETILQSNIQFDIIFGPAYKGIPLAAGVAAALARRAPHLPISYAYNRKEAKDHGEGGDLVGAPLIGKRVLLVDDVISAGTAIRESAKILTRAQATLVAACVALDRQEATGGKDIPTGPRISAVAAAASELAVPVFSILTLSNLLAYLQSQNTDLKSHVAAVQAYRDNYGAL